MMEALRPLTLGEILDRTMQLYRRNFLLLAGTAGLPMLVLLGCAVIFGVVFAVLGAGAGIALHSQALSFTMIGILGFVLVAVSIAATVFTQAGVTGAGLAIIRGHKPKIREALAGVRPRFWRYCGLVILQMLFAAGIPGAALGVLLVIGIPLSKSGAIDPTLSGIILFFAFAAAAAVAVMLGMQIAMGMAIAVAEDRPAVASLKRAIELSKGTRWRIFVMFLVVWALTMALLMIAYVPMVVVIAIAGLAGHGGPGSPQAIALMIVAYGVYMVVDLAIQAIVPPAYLISLLLFYYDQRIRKEGFDIELLMQQAGLAVPEAQPPAPEQV